MAAAPPRPQQRAGRVGREQEPAGRWPLRVYGPRHTGWRTHCLLQNFTRQCRLTLRAASNFGELPGSTEHYLRSPMRRKDSLALCLPRALIRTGGSVLPTAETLEKQRPEATASGALEARHEEDKRSPGRSGGHGGGAAGDTSPQTAALTSQEQ